MHEMFLFCIILAMLIRENDETYNDKAPTTVSSSWKQSQYFSAHVKEARQDLKRKGNFRVSKIWPVSAALQKKSEINSVTSKNCLHIPVRMNVCPPGFTTLFHDGSDLCYTTKENHAFPPSCPYPHFLPFHQIKNVSDIYIHYNFWINAFRNASSGFAHFEWFENGAYYGQRVTDPITNAKDYKDKDCLVYENGVIVRVSCSRKFHSVCMYSPEKLQQPDLVNKCRQKEYEKCIVSDYNLTQPKCFCKKTIVSQPEKNLFCKKLAEPIHPYQTELLIKHFELYTDKCWIGLYKSSGICKWASTKEAVSYTRWAKPENCHHSEGAFVFGRLPYHGWVLEMDRTLKCALCEVTLDLERSALELKHIPRKNELELSIHNFASISRLEGLSLYCFSDSNSNDFKHVVSVDKENAENRNDCTVLKITDVADHPSYYWCEVFEYSSKNVIRSNTVLVTKRNSYGQEFSLVVIVTRQFLTDPFIEDVHVEICQLISNQIESKYKDILQFLRPMRASFDEDKNQMTLLLHLTTKKSSQTIKNIHEDLLKILKSISEDDQSFTIGSFLSSEVCLDDTTVTLDGEILKWPETKVGVTAIPINKLCLDETRNMLPVIRKCEGDFLHGATWTDPTGTCAKNTTYSERTEELFNLVSCEAPADDITNDLVRITQENDDYQPIDVHLVSVVLERLVRAKEEVNQKDFSTVISNVMHFHNESLKQAQHLLNSTDKILSALDDFINSERPLLLVTHRLIIQVTDLRKTNITGLALYTKKPDISDFKSYKISPLNIDTSFDSLLRNEALETAVLLPAHTIGDIKKKLPSNKPIRLVITVFYNDLLFNEQEDIKVTQQSRTKIISVSIPGFTGVLDSPIKMAFRMPKNYSNIKNCSHWSYGLDEFMVSIYGKWKTDAPSQENSNLLEVCDFFHMTHFGILLQNRLQEYPHHEVALEIITAIGSALSLIGIIPIFGTAVAFKSWRSRPGNIILINFCIAISIQIILMFSLYAVKEDGAACKFVGAALHYMVLSEFCWMFVVAILQHRRFVMVFKPHEETIVRKCLVVGWGFPLIPVVITVSVSVDNYSFNLRGFCTVEGWYYYFGYLLPIVLILCSNAFIFTKIIYSVSRQSTETCAQRSRNYKLEILLALFLFFVLGITWIFGIIGAFGNTGWATYIFCITATLRGLVLFLFFIIGNKETRLMWTKHSTYYMAKKLQKSGGTQSSNVTTVSSE